ncbi:MAG: hypothetical protein ABSG21_12480, partial [Spirochaetia bacterium]
KAAHRDEIRRYRSTCSVFTDAYIEFADSLKTDLGSSTQALSVKIGSIGRLAQNLEYLTIALLTSDNPLRGKFNAFSTEMERHFEEFSKKYLKAVLVGMTSTVADKVLRADTEELSKYQSSVYFFAREFTTTIDVYTNRYILD